MMVEQAEKFGVVPAELEPLAADMHAVVGRPAASADVATDDLRLLTATPTHPASLP